MKATEEPKEEKEAMKIETEEKNEPEKMDIASKGKEKESSEDASSPTASTAVPMEVEIVVSFDTTGSMYPCLSQVRRVVDSFVRRILHDIPGARVAIIAHGDYKKFDPGSAYEVTSLDFTTDEKKLCDFIKDVPSTGGGDFPECYELALQHARGLSWASDGQPRSKALVMIGDATPHTASESTMGLDWQEECKKLKTDGVHIYAVQALGNRMSTSFYQGLANLTSGYYLELHQFNAITDFLTAIFRERSPDLVATSEKEVQSSGRMNRNLHSLFDTIQGRAPTEFSAPSSTFAAASSSGELSPVPPSRFQVLDVDENCDIKSFVTANGVPFQKGRGFYQLTKPETVRKYKEVVVFKKTSGDF